MLGTNYMLPQKRANAKMVVNRVIEGTKPTMQTNRKRVFSFLD